MIVFPRKLVFYVQHKLHTYILVCLYTEREREGFLLPKQEPNNIT